MGGWSGAEGEDAEREERKQIVLRILPTNMPPLSQSDSYRKHEMQGINFSFGFNSHSTFLSMQSVILMVKDE